MSRFGIVGVWCAVVLTGSSAFAAGATSAPAFVYAKPELSSHWHTVSGGNVTVPVELPAGAKSATLTVTGLGYSETYEGLAGPTYTFGLPVPTSAQGENVYKLTLAFDNGEVRTAKIATVRDFGSASSGTTRCILPAGSPAWNSVKSRALLPVPYGTTSLVANGVETIDADTCTGPQGWAIQRVAGTTELEMTTLGSTYLAVLDTIRGLVITIR